MSAHSLCLRTAPVCAPSDWMCFHQTVSCFFFPFLSHFTVGSVCTVQTLVRRFQMQNVVLFTESYLSRCSARRTHVFFGSLATVWFTSEWKSPVCFSVPLYPESAFCVGDGADLACSLDVTRCLQLAAAAGGLSAQTESVGGIKGPSPKKATGVGLCLVCSLCCFWLHSYIACMCCTKVCISMMKLQFKPHQQA